MGNVVEKQQTVLAICYDFDKTLSPTDMQAQGFIQSIDCEVADFWKESNILADENEMDQNLAYMYLMAKKSREKNQPLTRKTLREAGAKVELFPGVETWFERLNEYGRQKGILVEHYVISSGLKEMVEGSRISKQFQKIYASSFCFNDEDEVVWPAQVVNYTNKTQFLFRIEKGVLDINDQGVNSYYEPNQYRVPFRNMVYIGDSDPDIPCMKLVNTNGGHSSGVYDPETQNKTKVYRMLQENRIRFFEAADYSEDSKLETLVKQIIDRTAANEVLEQAHFNCVGETEQEVAAKSEMELEKERLINELEESMNFRSTHKVIRGLEKVTDWSLEQKMKLIHIANVNNQVRFILGDSDVKRFYTKICNGIEDVEADVVRKGCGIASSDK